MGLFKHQYCAILRKTDIITKNKLRRLSVSVNVPLFPLSPHLPPKMSLNKSSVYRSFRTIVAI